MKQEKPMCWCCVWRDITGPDNDPTLGCGHTSAQIRRRFEGSSTAEYCKEYLEDDPELKLKIDRITRETLMKNIHQLVVTDGHYCDIFGCENSGVCMATWLDVGEHFRTDDER